MASASNSRFLGPRLPLLVFIGCETAIQYFFIMRYPRFVICSGVRASPSTSL